MKLKSTIVGVAGAAALMAFACDRREPLSEEVREERAEEPYSAARYAPLQEPSYVPEISDEGASPTEAVGLSVGRKALGELSGAHREVQLACIGVQEALYRAGEASNTEWNDAKLRLEQALHRVGQTVSTMDADVKQRAPEVKTEVKGEGNEPTPQRHMPEMEEQEVER